MNSQNRVRSLRPFNSVRCPRCGRHGYVMVSRRSSLTGEITALKVEHDDGRSCKFGKFSQHFDELMKVYSEAVRISKLIEDIERTYKRADKITPSVWGVWP